MVNLFLSVSTLTTNMGVLFYTGLRRKLILWLSCPRRRRDLIPHPSSPPCSSTPATHVNEANSAPRHYLIASHCHHTPSLLLIDSSTRSSSYGILTTSVCIIPMLATVLASPPSPPSRPFPPKPSKCALILNDHPRHRGRRLLG